MRGRLFMAVLVAAGLMLAGNATAQVLYRFNTPDATLSPDDGFDPAVVTITADPNIVGPASGAELITGNVGLARCWNTEWAGFSMSSDNGTTIDNADEFNTRYFTWTVSARSGYMLNLASLDFNAARGGGDPATQVRRFELYAKVNGGSFAFGDTPILSIPNETGTRTATIARSADLSGPAFRGIESITFRYYPLTPANGNTVDFSDMTLRGEAVVPEPGSLALLGLAAIPLLRRRREV